MRRQEALCFAVVRLAIHLSVRHRTVVTTQYEAEVLVCLILLS